ncbi:hypothetical protein [Spirosoma harenae]
MKSLFPYAVMFVLFLAGNKLVERQQQYNQLNQVATPTKSVSLIGLFSAHSNDSGMQISSKPLQSGNHANRK